MLPPGCARLATKPCATGSLTAMNTIGTPGAADSIARNPMLLLTAIASGTRCRRCSVMPRVHSLSSTPQR